MFEKPQSEHEWFRVLAGEWTAKMECTMPDQSTQTSEAPVTCRSLNGMWYLIESSGDDPETGPWSTCMTLGFDPGQRHYVGTFTGSMMTHLWLYRGSIDKSGRRLTLKAEGPRFDGQGTAEYRDSIEIVDDNLWILSSEILNDDGQWTQIMRSEHRRK